MHSVIELSVNSHTRPQPLRKMTGKRRNNGARVYLVGQMPLFLNKLIIKRWLTRQTLKAPKCQKNVHLRVYYLLFKLHWRILFAVYWEMEEMLMAQILSSWRARHRHTQREHPPEMEESTGWRTMTSHSAEPTLGSLNAKFVSQSKHHCSGFQGAAHPSKD